jgi:hypothetical protein
MIINEITNKFIEETLIQIFHNSSTFKVHRFTVERELNEWIEWSQKTSYESINHKNLCDSI